MDKKFQIFISSTYEDLREEREQVIKAVLEMGHIPVGMEMFSAADEEQWKIIQKQIDESDYYVVIAANKYGSVTSEGISYTEKEYDYAVKVGVPALGFVLAENAPWPSEKSESAAKARKALGEFKAKIKKRLINFWANKEDLHAKVSIALMKTINTTPRVGWVRATESPGPEVIRELTRLSVENATLRNDIFALKNAIEEKSDEVRAVFHILQKNQCLVKIRTTGQWQDAARHECTLLDIFDAVAPNLITENTTLGMAQNIALGIGANAQYFKQWPVPKNMVTGWAADLAALDLIEPSKKKHSVSDKENYWSLTRLGKQVLKQSRRIRLEEGIITDNTEPGEGAVV